MSASSRECVCNITEQIGIIDGERELKAEKAYVRWALANRSEFRSRMPLSNFMRLIPNWLLGEVTASNEPSEAATFLAIYHEGLWSDAPGRIVATLEEITTWVIAFATACSFEMQRRAGVMRWTIDGDDRLKDVGQAVSLEFNPAIKHLHLHKPLPELGSAEATEHYIEVLTITLGTDWADLNAFFGD